MGKKRPQPRPRRFKPVITVADAVGKKQFSALKKRLALRKTVLRRDMSIGSNPVSMFIPITKIDEDKREVHGIAAASSLDKQNEIVLWKATKAALPEYSQWRNLREMHRADSAVGTVPFFHADDNTQKLHVVAKVVDDEAWRKCKEKVYKGFSIGGQATDRRREFDGTTGKIVSKVHEYRLNEISLVDRPANPDCIFTMVKRDSSSKDHLLVEVGRLRKRLKTLGQRVMSDEQIHKLSDKRFALIRRYKKGGRTVVKRFCPIPDTIHAVSVLKQLDKLPFSKRERTIVHERCKRVMKKSHNPRTCPYCLSQRHLIIEKGGEKQVMALSKRTLGRAIEVFNRLGSILEAEGVMETAEEAEGTIAPTRPYVEGESRKDAPVKDDSEEGMGTFEGPDYDEHSESDTVDHEGVDDELEGLLEELEGDRDDSESSAYAGDKGFEPEMTDDDRRTRLFDSEHGDRSVEDKKELEAIEEELEAIEEELEAIEDEKPRARKRPAANDTVGKAILSEMKKMNRRLDRSRPRPARRTGKIQKRERTLGADDGEKAENTELTKRMEKLASDRATALELRRTGEVLSAKDEAFCQKVLDDSIKARAEGNLQ